MTQATPIIDRNNLAEQIDRYKWYHRIEVVEGVYTTPAASLDDFWDFIRRGTEGIDYTAKRVLDIGCRDGLWSFHAEARGASKIVGIDNDISRGATDLLIPVKQSKVQMYELNVGDLTPQHFGMFDIIQFFGVLYHLRYPFHALQQITNCLSDNGLLLIESGMLVDRRLRNLELLYCPVERSPYEATSCTFFNSLGLQTTLRSMGCKLITQAEIMPRRQGAKTTFHSKLSAFITPRVGMRQFIKQVFHVESQLPVNRQFFVFKKSIDTERDSFLKDYWEGTHHHHTTHGS